MAVIAGFETAQIGDQFDDVIGGVPITSVQQRERLGLGHMMLAYHELRPTRDERESNK
jgi:hypothetical protein